MHRFTVGDINISIGVRKPAQLVVVVGLMNLHRIVKTWVRKHLKRVFVSLLDTDGWHTQRKKKRIHCAASQGASFDSVLNCQVNLKILFDIAIKR